MSGHSGAVGRIIRDAALLVGYDSLNSFVLHALPPSHGFRPYHSTIHHIYSRRAAYRASSVTSIAKTDA
jgi:hypothetical protein